MRLNSTKQFFKTPLQGRLPGLSVLKNRFAPQRVNGVKTQRGFTLLLAVLISSVLIALGSAIFDIAIKEVTLSSSGRESQFAFYSADSGIECALYWDLKQDAFSTTSALATAKCGNIDATLIDTLSNAGTVNETLVTDFTFPTMPTSSPCTIVKVTRQYYPTRTTIQSSGYNTCITTNPLRLERTIRVTY